MASLRQVQPVLMSRDVEASIRFYAKFGFEVAFRDDPDRVRYAGLRRDGIELHLQFGRVRSTLRTVYLGMTNGPQRTADPARPRDWPDVYF